MYYTSRRDRFNYSRYLILYYFTFLFYTGQLKRAWSYPAKAFASIMDLTGDKIVRISDDGAAQITVDSGLAVYNYILPAQSK